MAGKVLPGRRTNEECSLCESRMPSVKRRANGDLLCDHCASDEGADGEMILDERYDLNRPGG